MRVPRPNQIELADGELTIPILYEDRSVIAVDKPAGWLLAPDSWENTGRNLQLAIQSSLNGGDFWARSRNLKYLRFVHRLDAETTGVLLFAKSPGALRSYTELFETRRVDKTYLAVVEGVPSQDQWTCSLPLLADPAMRGRMQVVTPPPRQPGRAGNRPPPPASDAKDAETNFRVLLKLRDTAVVEARPTTGRTHQIRVHLAATDHPVVGDAMYGRAVPGASKGRQRIALRAVGLAYRDPFLRRPVRIEAPLGAFALEYGFDAAACGRARGFSLRAAAKPA